MMRTNSTANRMNQFDKNEQREIEKQKKSTFRENQTINFVDRLKPLNTVMRLMKA